METNTGIIALPGDQVEVQSKTQHVILGPGLRTVDEMVYATKAGLLNFKTPNTYWLEACQKRYWPARGDCVIGIILQKVGDNFRVNIGGPEPATLSVFAFEGATKRNRPNIKVGDAIYCQVIAAHPAMEPEVVCINSYGRKGAFGILESETSNIITVPLQVVHLLLSKRCPLLTTLGKKLQFEIAVGQNGRVWINGNSAKNTVAISQAVKACEKLSLDQIREMCQRIAGS